MIPAVHQEEEIRRLVTKINEAWLKGDQETLNDCFHESVVVYGPGFQEVGRGKQACVSSYEQFIRRATVRQFNASDPQIDVWPHAAVATFFWEIRYQMNGEDLHESGHDVFVFVREHDQWLAAWRTVLPSPKASASSE